MAQPSDASTVQTAQRRLAEMADLNVLVRDPVEVRGSDAGPLAGRPVVVKANIAIGGLPHCGGSPGLADHIAEESATAVTRLLEAGAVVVGQTNLHELALGITSNNAHHGPVRNPHDPSRMALGSSGGTAAAVGGGAVDMGLGSDTGGSGRLPAAACGCVGLRPSAGRYPGDGVLNLSRTLDTISSFGRTVSDVALIDGVVAADAAPLETVAPGSVRLGVPRSSFWSGVSASMVKRCEARLDQLTAAGVELVEVEAATLLEQSRPIAMPIVLAEMEQFWTPFAQVYLGQSLAEFVTGLASPDVAGVFGLVVDGAAPGTEDYERMRDELRVTLAADYAAVFVDNDVDALIFPTLPVTAPPVGETDTVDLDGVEVSLFEVMIDREAPVSLAGIPAISVPAGLAEDGMPYGLELVGPSGSDRRLLSLALMVESVLGVAP